MQSSHVRNLYLPIKRNKTLASNSDGKLVPGRIAGSCDPITKSTGSSWHPWSEEREARGGRRRTTTINSCDDFAVHRDVVLRQQLSFHAFVHQRSTASHLLGEISHKVKWRRLGFPLADWTVTVGGWACMSAPDTLVSCRMWPLAFILFFNICKLYTMDGSFEI